MATAVVAQLSGEEMAKLFAENKINLQDFTPSEQSCISAKIRKVMDEGKPQDQAVAIAISACAPGKSRKNQKADDGEKGEKKIGGNYTAVDNGDGTFDVLEVPIFSEIPAGDRRNKKSIDKAWMLKAVEQNRKRKAEGYLPPVHVHHHEEGKDTSFAGYLELTGVKEIVYQGKKVSATFANIVKMPSEIFSRVEKGFLPYRSVEIHDWEHPEIDSLALLPDEVPFFRLALLTIGKKVKKEASIFSDISPALYWKAHESSMAILFRFDAENKMAKTEKFQEEKKEEEEEKKEGMQDEAPPAPEQPAQPDKSEMMLGQMLALLQQMAKLMGIGNGQQQPATPSEDVIAPVGMKNKEKGGENMADESKNMAKLEGEIAALKAKDTEREKREKVSALVAKAEKDLERYNIDADTRKKIEKFAAAGDELLSDFVAAFKAHAIMDPPSDDESLDHALVSGEGKETIEKFAAKHQGPEHLAWAKKQTMAHAAYIEASGSDITLEDWLETNYRQDFAKK